MYKRGLTAALLTIIFCTLTVCMLTDSAYAAPDEYRAFWVTGWTAGFLNQSEVDGLLGIPGDPNAKGTIREANCNAVIVQVRRSSDVCYPSGMGEPYFTSGLSPADFNALQAIIDAAHDTTGGKQRIEVHAWIVVFRTAGGTVYQAHDDTPTGSLINLDNYWPTREGSVTGDENDVKAFDPGHPLAEEYLVNVCMDLVSNFDIDGIHYDYIRFHANFEGFNPTSVARYKARYGLSTDPVSTDEQFKQWRRDQITALVRKVYAKIQAVKPWVKQSASVVTWDPSPRTATRDAFKGTRPYYDVYSDWDAWLQEGILDMAVPMNYYDQLGSLAYEYVDWMNFIKDRKGNRHTINGPGIYKNYLQDAIDQLLMTRNASPSGNHCEGWSGYSYQSPYVTHKSTGPTDPAVYGPWSTFAAELVSQVTQEPANIPVTPWKANPTKGHICGTVTYASYPGTNPWADGALATVTGGDLPAGGRTQYCDGTGFYAFIDLTPGTYTVTVSKFGYPNSQTTVNVQIGQVTGNMYVTDMVLGVSGPPVISNVQSGSITETSAVITWDTNQPSSSRVEYGTTTGYGSMTPLDSDAVTSHSMTLSGLNPGTVYHFRVISANSNGSTTSGDYMFATAGVPTITNAQAYAVAATSAIITWDTNLVSGSTVNYGATTALGSQETNPISGTSHLVSLNGLSPDTTYYFQCASTNAYGTSVTQIYSFRTLAASAETVIDNTDPGWSNTSPNGNNWNTGSAAGVPKIGANYLYYSGDGSTVESSKTRKCRWTPNLSAGIYDVYVYYQMGTNRNPSAPYKVYYNGGQVASTQNQYSPIANRGGWYLVGRDLPFAAGTSGYVELTTLTLDAPYVSADAAKWVYKGSLDTTAPVMQSVTDDKYSVLTSALFVNWSATDPESGITRCEYTIGTQPGATDVRGWTDAGLQSPIHITGLNLVRGTKYYISVRAVNGVELTSSPMSSSGLTVVYPLQSIAEAKGMQNNTPVCLPYSSVTAEFPACFYIEDASRASGIRVDALADVALDQKVQVMGLLGLLNSCERMLTDCKIIPTSLFQTIRPLGMTMLAVGGIDFNALTPGITDGFGLNNIGLLARVAGSVTQVVSDGFYIDDGSGIRDDSGYTGLKIWTGTPNSVTKPGYVTVTGIISCRVGADGKIYPQMLAREILPL